MKAYPIEDTIIAYFDGRLNDSEGAELLHRVSVSPEIREIFEQHEALRQIALRAAQQTTIAPELEESLFRRIEGLQDEEKLPIGFWTARRLSVMVAAVALILVGFVHSYEFGNSGTTAASNMAKAVALSTQHSMTGARFETNLPGERSFASISLDRNNRVALEASAPIISPGGMASAEAVPPTITLHPIPRTANIASVQWPSSGGGTLVALRELPMTEASSKFEVSLASPISGGFAVPGSVPQPKLFSDFVMRLGYNLDERNQVGISVTDGSFVGLTSSAETGFKEVTMQFQHGYAGTLFYRHREPVAGGLFFVTGGAGGGVYSLGTLLNAELGIEIPFGERLLGGVSLVMSNQHQSGSKDALMSSTNRPVLYDASNVFNTLNGSIEYALTYRF